MEKEKLVEALRNEVNKSEEFKETLTHLSRRHRDRNELTLGALQGALPTLPRSTLGQVLEKLAGFGIGKLVLTKKGEIDALIHVHDTLQSIGQVALGKKDRFEPSRIKERTVVRSGQRVRLRGSAPVMAQHVSAHRTDSKLVISLSIGGKIVNIPIPPDMTATEVGQLVAKLKQVNE